MTQSKFDPIVCLGLAMGLAGGLWLFPAAKAVMAQPAPYEEVAPARLKPGDPLPAPTDRVVLTVHGASRRGAGGGPLKFDIATLEKLGLIRFTSKNRWYDDPVTYEGVLGSAFLDFVGVPTQATGMRMRALNDYAIRVPISDLRRWPVMLALKLNGKYMSVRGKGPIWVVYPNHLVAELGGPAHQGKWIWQLIEIKFE